LCRSVEANHAVKPATHQTETLSAGSLQRMVSRARIKCCASWRADSDAAGCSAANLTVA
jgi:hypothetical protein